MLALTRTSSLPPFTANSSASVNSGRPRSRIRSIEETPIDQPTPSSPEPDADEYIIDRLGVAVAYPCGTSIDTEYVIEPMFMSMSTLSPTPPIEPGPSGSDTRSSDAP